MKLETASAGDPKRVALKKRNRFLKIPPLRSSEYNTQNKRHGSVNLLLLLLSGGSLNKQNCEVILKGVIPMNMMRLTQLTD